MMLHPVPAPTIPEEAVMTSPTITVEYFPAAHERLPWLIAIDGIPTVRVAEGEHATAALTVIPVLLGEGWEPALAVYRALEDSVAITLDQWQDASDEVHADEET